MTDTKLLERAIAKCGRSKEMIARELKISTEALNAKICGKAEFTAGEIGKLTYMLYGVGSHKEAKDIFFAKRVD